ncbi:2-nitropropane dioxygenase [Saccharibacillus sp. O16]|nr:2-nitropropane dioxygenase [Saccharibacillus sp. O16]
MDWETRITRLLQIQYPILQGGLAYLGDATLAAAVSEAGGLGQITAMGLPDAASLRREIRLVRRLTSHPFGVNIALGMPQADVAERLRIVIEEKVPVVSLSGGDPSPWMAQLHSLHVVTLVLVSSRRQALKAEQSGASAVVAVGHEGGGHVGRDGVGTMVLVPAIVDAVHIPVIAAGGIADGRGWMAAQALGAEGVMMGTRWIATQECTQASPSYQTALLHSTEADTVVLKASLGSPGRALSNVFSRSVADREKKTPGDPAIRNLLRSRINKRWIHEGIEEEGFGWAGQAVGLIDRVLPAAELIRRMVQEAEEIRQMWGACNSTR